jgi:hypothetical protein
MNQGAPDRDSGVGQRQGMSAEPPAALALFRERCSDTPPEHIRVRVGSPEPTKTRRSFQDGINIKFHSFHRVATRGSACQGAHLVDELPASPVTWSVRSHLDVTVLPTVSSELEPVLAPV